MIGGAMEFVSSQQFGNWIGGKGFISNNQVKMNFSAGKYDITGFDTWQDAALDYFGFEKKYDPNNALFKGGSEPGVTDPITGDVFYNTSAFDANYDKLYFVADHEMRHQTNVLAGKYKDAQLTNKVVNNKEYTTYVYNYKRQGLYPKHKIDIELRILDMPLLEQSRGLFFLKFCFDNKQMFIIFVNQNQQ